MRPAVGVVFGLLLLQYLCAFATAQTHTTNPGSNSQPPFQVSPAQSGLPTRSALPGAAVDDDRAGSDTLSSLRRQINAGHADEALRRLDTLNASGTAAEGLQTLRGLAYYQEGKLPEADKAYSAALNRDPKDQEAAQMRGLTLFRLGRPAAAIPLLEGSRSWSSESKVDPSYVLALCYLDTRRYDDARHAFAAQYGFAPDSAAAYLLAARMLLRREYLPVAKEFAAKSLQLDPQMPLAHELLGEIALAGDHMDEAIAELEQEKARDPLEGPVYDRLGDAYYRAGRYEDSQRALQQAVLLEPNSTGPYILLGKVLLKRQDPLGAATYLERARGMDPANYRTHSLLGQAYRALGRQEDASREVQTAQSLQAASEPKIESAR